MFVLRTRACRFDRACVFVFVRAGETEACLCVCVRALVLDALSSSSSLCASCVERIYLYMRDLYMLYYDTYLHIHAHKYTFYNDVCCVRMRDSRLEQPLLSLRNTLPNRSCTLCTVLRLLRSGCCGRTRDQQIAVSKSSRASFNDIM